VKTQWKKWSQANNEKQNKQVKITSKKAKVSNTSGHHISSSMQKFSFIQTTRKSTQPF
jgi:hypothetical protein